MFERTISIAYFGMLIIVLLFLLSD